MSTSLREQLQIRDKERTKLSERIIEILTLDTRIVVAWLTGSLSRGSPDSLSDIDLWVVVSDDSIDSFVSHRWDHAALPAPPIILLDNLRNAPPNGAYLLALYPGDVGPQHVDWFWQPQSEARVPNDEMVLFDHVGLQVVGGEEWRQETHQPPGPWLVSEEHTAVLTQTITFFWAMSLIVAKYIARQNGETVARMTKVIANSLGEIERLLNGNIRPIKGDTALSQGLASIAPSEQLEVPYDLVRDAAGLHQAITDQGASTPWEALPQIYRYFELTQALV